MRKILFFSVGGLGVQVHNLYITNVIVEAVTQKWFMKWNNLTSLWDGGIAWHGSSWKSCNLVYLSALSQVEIPVRVCILNNAE